MEGCNKEQCFKQDCQVGDWNLWSACSATCGPAQRQRQREVLRARSDGGNGCSLEVSEIQPCPDSHECAFQDCEWGEWQAWSRCSAECDGGQQKRTRHIAVMPEIGGKMCQEHDMEEVRACGTQPCHAQVTCQDGAWGHWDRWSTCSQSCGGGTTFRRRRMEQMPNECGKPVMGDARETKFCNVQVSCDPAVDCEFTEWGSWSDCSATCNGVTRRSRRIKTYGSGLGAFCEGALKETFPCSPGPEEHMPQGCLVDEVPVDCVLSEWGTWSECSESCGAGAHTRTRRILQSPKDGGKSCDSQLVQLRTCKQTACPRPEAVNCAYGIWEDWGACTKCGGERTRFRSILRYAEHGGQACEPFAGEEVGACPRACHARTYCTWGEWGSWGGCSAPCGESKRMRRRHLKLTYMPSAPPPDVNSFAALYHDLRQQSEVLQANRPTELAAAFAGGLGCFGAAVLVLRVWRCSGSRPRVVSVSNMDSSVLL